MTECFNHEQAHLELWPQLAHRKNEGRHDRLYLVLVLGYEVCLLENWKSEHQVRLTNVNKQMNISYHSTVVACMQIS